jgi:DNA transposition AAA+ family ATPase
MKWTMHTLNAFKTHYGVNDYAIAKGIGVAPSTVFKLRNYDLDIEKFVPRLNAYYEAVKASKILEHQKMIEYYESFRP